MHSKVNSHNSNNNPNRTLHCLNHCILHRRLLSVLCEVFVRLSSARFARPLCCGAREMPPSNAMTPYATLMISRSFPPDDPVFVVSCLYAVATRPLCRHRSPCRPALAECPPTTPRGGASPAGNRRIVAPGIAWNSTAAAVAEVGDYRRRRRAGSFGQAAN